VKAYNAAATSLNPPRATVDWSKVSHCTFLEEIDFLHDPRDQIRTQPWAQPVNRAVMKQAQRVAQARVEIDRCNVEVRRLHTAIDNEERHFTKVLRDLEAHNQEIYYAVLDYCMMRRRVNAHLLSRIAQIYALEFTGNPSPGVRKGTMADGPPFVELTVRADDRVVQDDDEDGSDVSDDDEQAANVNKLVDYITSI
jgi:hypothetical protein